jgi:hypothetical protein
MAPILAVAVVMLLLARAYYDNQRYLAKLGPGALAGFADIGTISGSQLGLDSLVMDHNPTGFDGQFFYFIALDPSQPVICSAHPRPPRCALDQAFGIVRAERVLYPYTAALLTLGHTDWVPLTLLLVNFAAILVTVWLVGRMCVAAGASPWLGAAAGLYCGEMQGFLRDLADPFAVLWVVLAVYLLRRERYLGSALAVAAALLTREQLVLTVPLLFLPLAILGRWRTLAQCALIALLPFAAWQTVLRLLWGQWPLSSGDTQGAGVADGILPLPFHGLFEKSANPQFAMILAFVVVPLLLACGASLLALGLAQQRSGWRAMLADPVPLLVLLYAVLLSLTSWILWQDMWTPSRLAALPVVLGVLVVAGLPRPQLRTSYATLMAFSGFVPLMLL